MSQTLLSKACRATAGRANSPAALFVQLFRRSFSANSSQVQSSSIRHATRAVPSLLSSSMMRHNGRYLASRWHTAPSTATGMLRNQTHNFSTTSSQCATKAILNPRTDEEGKALEINITPRAAKVYYHI